MSYLKDKFINEVEEEKTKIELKALILNFKNSFEGLTIKKEIIEKCPDFEDILCSLQENGKTLEKNYIFFFNSSNLKTFYLNLYTKELKIEILGSFGNEKDILKINSGSKSFDRYISEKDKKELKKLILKKMEE